MNRLLLFGLLLFCMSILHAQETSTRGQDFWLAFMSNWHDNDVDTYTLHIASGSDGAQVTISAPLHSWSQQYTILPNASVVVNLPANISWSSGSCVTTNHGIHITSDYPIQVQAYNHSSTHSAVDATALLTTQSLGSDYIVDTYPFTCSTADSYAQFSVLAIRDSTVIDILLTGNTSAGHTAGSTITVVLNAGQIYQVQGTGIADESSYLSGTHVSSRQCIPFALFMGNSVTNVPSNFNTSSDHTFAQAMPTSTWQTSWLLLPSLTPGNETPCEYARITALNDGTQILSNGTNVATINHGQTYELSITSILRLSATQPCQVVQYATSRSGSGVGRYGDASSFLPNATNCLNQYFQFIPFELFGHQGYSTQYYLNLICPTNETSLIQLGGAPITDAIPSASFSSIAGTNYSYLRAHLPGVTQRITTTGSGFIGSVYGKGEDWEGYTISLGGVGPTSELFAAHDAIVDTTCMPPYLFLGRTFSQSGIYSMPNQCGDTVTLSLTVFSPDTIRTIATICGGSYQWLGYDISDPGDYIITGAANAYGCDSIFHLHLSVYSPSDTNLSITSCDSSFTYADSTFSSDGFYDFTFTDAHGCDSTVHLQLLFAPSYQFLHTDTICSYEEYTWINGVTYNYSTEVDYAIPTINGCDSTFHLSLTARDCDDPNPNIWVPNVFTPNCHDNQVFQVRSMNIDEITVSIHNRWGERISVFDGLRESWDGTYRGLPCPQGAYIYQIRYHALNSSETLPPITGTVLLLR